MSLRAKCLPQKLGLQLSATKQTTFNTSVKRTVSKYRFRGEKTLSIASKKNNQLTKTRPARSIAIHRNGRAILKCTSTKSATTTSRNKAKLLSKAKLQGGAKTSKTYKIKTSKPHTKLENSPSSINCSRSGRKLVPARCACANDSVTTRCSIHNNVRKTASPNSIEPKLSSDTSSTTKRNRKPILRSNPNPTISENKTMSSMTVPMQAAATTSLTSTVCNSITSQSFHNNRSNKNLLHTPQFSLITDDVSPVKERSYRSPNPRMNSSCTPLPHQPDKERSLSPSVQTTKKSENADKTKLTTVVPGLPSPTDSTSDTSDYQRSTPSPKDEQNSSMGTTMKEGSANAPSQNEDPNKDPDPGFGDEDDISNINETIGTSQVPLVLQQLCAALTKMPDTKRNPAIAENKSAINSLPTTNVVNNNSLASQVPPKNSTPLPTSIKKSQSITESINKYENAAKDVEHAKSILGKRRKSLQSVLENESSSNCANVTSLPTSKKFKKRKSTEIETEDKVNNSKTASTAIQSHTPTHHQGKITEYLPEMKDSNPLIRKEKLEKVSTMAMNVANSPEPLSEEIISSKIKTEPSVPPTTTLSVDDVEEGVLIIDDDDEPDYSTQEGAEEYDETQKNNRGEILNPILLENRTQSMTENDLKAVIPNDTRLPNDTMSLKSTNKYSLNDDTKRVSGHISDMVASISEQQLPLDMLIKDEDSKIMPSSPLTCSSSSSGISSTSSSASFKDDSSSVISLSRMSSSSSSGASSYTKDYDHLFEIPRAIRFPPPNSNTMGLNRNSGMSVTRISRSSDTENGTNNNNLTETVICRWELCGQEFDSSGKLLDHLKTVHARIDYTNKSNNNNNSYEESENDKDSNNQSTSSVHYKCLWEGCKVYGKGSSTKSWLEKHVIANHGGNKPFQCIVDGCKERFGTQSLLERHVNSHFKSKNPSGTSTADSTSNLTTAMHSSSLSAASSNQHSSSKLSKNSLSNMNGHNRLYHSKLSHAKKKLMAPNGKKLKYRKTIYSARIFDLFDLGVMAQVRQRITAFEIGCQKLRSEDRTETPEMATKKSAHKQKLKCIEKASNKSSAATKPTNNYGLLDQMIVFRNEVLAKRTDPDGQVRILLQWVPNGIFENEWSLMQNASNTKHIKMSSLSSQQRAILSNEILELGEPISKTETVREGSEKKGRKTKAPQSKSSALS